MYVNPPQNQVSNIQKGTVAQFTVPELPGQVFSATVQSMSQAISSSSGSMLVQLSAENKRGELLPGGYASVSFSIPPQAHLLSVPPSALVYTKDGVKIATRWQSRISGFMLLLVGGTVSLARDAYP